MTLVLDVRFYSQVTNAPVGIPSDWPESTIEIDSALPVTAGRTRMTLAQFASYKAARQASYDSWFASWNATMVAQKAADRDAGEPDLATIRDQAAQSVTDNNTFLAIGSPTNAQVLAQVQKLSQQNNKIIKALGRLVAMTWT